MSENATILTAHKQERREQIHVAEGDTLILRGTEYTISKDRYGYITLTPVEAAAESQPIRGDWSHGRSLTGYQEEWTP